MLFGALPVSSMALPVGFCRPPIRPAVTVRRSTARSDQTFRRAFPSIDQYHENHLYNLFGD